MITFKVDRIMGAKLRTEYTQAADIALMDMLETRYSSGSDGLIDASYQKVENVPNAMNLKSTLNALFLRNLEP